MKRLLSLKSAAGAALGLLLAALGGCVVDNDPGPAPITYTGSTAPAVLDPTNAQDLAVLAYLQGYDARDYNGLSNLQGTFGNTRPDGVAPSASRLARLARLLAEGVSARRARAQTTQEFDLPASCNAGSVTGSYTTDFDRNDPTNAPPETFVMHFDQYCVNGLVRGTSVLDGDVTLERAPLDTANGTDRFDARYTFQFDQFHMGPNVLDGTLSLVRQGASAVVTVDVIASGDGHAVYRFENFVAAFTNVAGGLQVTVDGRFYLPATGYVDVVTETPFVIASDQFWPGEGQLVVMGANNALSRLIANDDSASYDVEADFDNDGVIDFGRTTYAWGFQNDFQNFF